MTITAGHAVKVASDGKNVTDATYPDSTAPVTVTFADPITFNFANGLWQKTTLTATTAITLQNLPPGVACTLELNQDGTGNWVPTWTTTISWLGGGAPPVKLTAGGATFFQFVYDGSTIWGLGGNSLSIAAGKTLTVSKTMTLTCADDTAVATLPAGAATLLYSGGALGTPASGTLTNCTGGAASTAATLATARAINGVNFDGSGPITVREVPVTTLPTTGNYIADSPCMGALLAVSGGIAIYDLVYVDTSGTISKAKADAAATVDTYLGMATAAASGGNAVNVLKSGVITYSSWTWATAGLLLYVSDGTAGLITVTKPTTAGTTVKVVGITLSATSIQLFQGHPSVVN